MDDSDMSASSTPLRPFTRMNRATIDSDSEDSSINEAKPTNGIEIPESDVEDTSDSSLSSENINNTPVAASKVLKSKHNSLLRKSLGYKSALEDSNDSSQYMSFQSAATLSPETDNAEDQSPSPIIEEKSDVSGNTFDLSTVSKVNLSQQIEDEIGSFQSGQNSISLNDSVFGLKKKTSDGNLKNFKSAPSQSEIEEDSKSDSFNESYNSVSHSRDESAHSNVSNGSVVHSRDKSAHSNVSNGSVIHSKDESLHCNDLNGSAAHSNNESVHSNEFNYSAVEDDDGEMKNLNSSLHSISEKVEELEFCGSPKRASLIDLTQSDSSLQNSPVGATREQGLMQRNLEDVVNELSIVTNDLMVKEALLESISIQTLPDNGRNLIMMVSELKKRKIALDEELSVNQEYAAQKATVEQMRSNLERKLLGSKQATLNFQPSFKTEPKEYESIDSGEDASPSSVKSFSSNSTKPNWGDLPNPDMTISGFGKRAMQTHMVEKSLTQEALSSLHNALKTCPSEDTYAEDPKYLKVELMPHQKHGLAWMLWREQEKPSGGILADDMGLGKTLSMISLILKDAENKEKSDDDESSDDESPTWLNSKYSRMPRGGTLVVCPASLVAQWEHEIYKRVKRRALSVELYHGPKRESKPRRLAQYDVIVTTYNLVSRESGVDTPANATRMKEKGPLFMVKWERIILDEAHMVRNHKSQMALGVCELVGKHRWCLTGTPIQNKELDLYALLKFLQCSPFDDLTVWKKWVDNKNAAGMQRLSTMMKSLMLRRTKQQLQEAGDLNCLPEKYAEKIDVHLDAEELVLYEKIALFSSNLFADFLAQRAEKQQILDARYGMSTKPVWEQDAGPDNQFTTTKELANMHRKMKGISEIKTHQILVLLLRLRQICIHPGLVKKMVEDGDLDFTAGGVEDQSGLDVDLFNQMNNLNIDDSDVEKEEERDLLNKSGTFTVDNPILSFDRPSAKIRALLDLIQEKIMDTDDKAIIVSQWSSVLNIIAPFLKQMRIKFETLSGEVPVHKRQEIVNAINKTGSGPQILLLSLTAGGVGLNLVGANYLMLVDIHWNPQLEAQACDRIYRVGQKKPVYIYRFIVGNTIEERIMEIQNRKLALAANVLTGTRNFQASKLTLADLQMLFSAPAPSKPAAEKPELQSN